MVSTTVLCILANAYTFHTQSTLFSVAREHIQPIFQGICAKANGEPCCDWVGEDGAGHYVKMVHNGIEYGDMQVWRMWNGIILILGSTAYS